MRKIISILKKTVKPASPTRSQSRQLTDWQKAQRELLRGVDWSQWPYTVPVTWLEVA